MSQPCAGPDTKGFLTRTNCSKGLIYFDTLSKTIGTSAVLYFSESGPVLKRGHTITKIARVSNVSIRFCSRFKYRLILNVFLKPCGRFYKNPSMNIRKLPQGQKLRGTREKSPRPSSNSPLKFS